MFDVKDSDFFDMEDDAFDTIVEDDISFNGSIKMQKPFLIRGKITGKIETQSDLVIDTNAVVEADIKTAKLLAILRSLDTHDMSDMELADRILAGYSRNE